MRSLYRGVLLGAYPATQRRAELLRHPPKRWLPSLRNLPQPKHRHPTHRLLGSYQTQILRSQRPQAQTQRLVFTANPTPLPHRGPTSRTTRRPCRARARARLPIAPHLSSARQSPANHPHQTNHPAPKHTGQSHRLCLGSMVEARALLQRRKSGD
jgi:hypothetical protein